MQGTVQTDRKGEKILKMGRGDGTLDRHTAVVQDMHNLPGRRSDSHEEDRRGIIQSRRTMSPFPLPTKSSRQHCLLNVILPQVNRQLVPFGDALGVFVGLVGHQLINILFTRVSKPRKKRPPGVQRTYIGIGNVVGEVDVDDGETRLDGPFAVPSQCIILPTVNRLNFHAGALLLLA